MGFIKNLVSSIFGLLGGILGFVTGLLPKKKASNGYFLELDEATSGSRPAPQPPASNGKKAAKSATTEPPVASQPAKSPDAAKTTKVAEPTKVEASQNGKAPKAEPVKAPAPAAATKTPATPTETTFAPKYLAPSASGSNGRRRPGANMNAYLELARQVKTPANK
ncbi:hypothetical protein A6S26_12175 [Nostoc sp. ATCC 43529]|nr:hypothetical protein A6S26_12175 [Nostoc sp. ATCC 43529]